jgi:uncharacterized membrane protein
MTMTPMAPAMTTTVVMAIIIIIITVFVIVVIRPFNKSLVYLHTTTRRSDGGKHRGKKIIKNRSDTHIKTAQS